MIRVELPGVEEFKEEVLKDRNLLDRNIVRITIRRFPVKSMSYINHYLVELSTVIDTNGHAKILQAMESCGDTWKDNKGVKIEGDGEENSVKRCKELMDMFKELGFDVRSGRFVDESNNGG